MPRAKPDETALATLLDTFYYKEDLQSLLEDADLPVSGTKDELIDRLLEEADYSPEEFLNYHYKDDLKEMCDDLDLPVSGSKAELVDRLMGFLFDIEIEEAKEEEEPAPAHRPGKTAAKHERVEIPTTGLIGSEEGFLGLIKSIEGWSPLKRHRSEEGYQMDLRQYLQYECGYQCRLEGVEMADIVVEDKFPVEIKKNPTQAEYDRLLGQLTRMHRAKNFAIGVICDVRRLEMFIDFKQQIGRIFDDGSVAIVQK